MAKKLDLFGDFNWNWRNYFIFHAITTKIYRLQEYMLKS